MILERKFILMVFFTLVLFQVNLLSQSSIGLSANPIQLQFFFAEAKSSFVDEESQPWGYSAHPEILVHKRLNKHFDIIAGMGFLVSHERLKVFQSVRSFLLKTDSSFVPTSPNIDNIGLDIGKVNLNDIFLTLPVGCIYYTGKEEKNRKRFIFSVKSELGLSLTSFTQADIANIEYDAFFQLTKYPGYTRIENTSYEPQVESFFDSFRRDILFNTQVKIGQIFPLRNKKYMTINLSANYFHRSIRPQISKRKLSLGINFQFSSWL